MESVNTQRVSARVTPEYIMRAVRKYKENHREDAKAYAKQYILRKKEEDIEKWRAKSENANNDIIRSRRKSYSNKQTSSHII